MGGWLVELQNLRYRKCMGWLILIGLAGFVGLMQTGISVQQPFLPLKTIQFHLANYVRSGSDNSETTNSPLSKSKSTPKLPNNDTKLPTKNGEKSHPRIAVCLVGGARKFELTGPSLLEYVLNMYNNTDVFLYAPFDKDSHKFQFLKNANSLAAVRIFSPLKLDVTTVHSEALTSNGSPNGLQGLLQYFNLVEGCLTMIKFYQIRYKVKYDWIVRTRVDGYWNGPLPPPQSYLNERYIVPHGSQFGGLNDRLGIGNMETSEAALSRLSLVPLLHSSGYRRQNSETAFKHQLDVKGVKYEFKTFPFCIVSERKYDWPPYRWGVPVASLSTRGHLNGIKCRPCKPVAKGTEAIDIIQSLVRNWSWTLAPQALELCDAHDVWEEKWEDIFDKAAGPNLAASRKKIKSQTLSSCIKNFEAMKQKTAYWDAPSSKTICKKAYGQS